MPYVLPTFGLTDPAIVGPLGSTAVKLSCIVADSSHRGFKPKGPHHSNAIGSAARGLLRPGSPLLYACALQDILGRYRHSDFPDSQP
jgi:hypothetical protein